MPPASRLLLASSIAREKYLSAPAERGGVKLGLSATRPLDGRVDVLLGVCTGLEPRGYHAEVVLPRLGLDAGEDQNLVAYLDEFARHFGKFRGFIRLQKTLLPMT